MAAPFKGMEDRFNENMQRLYYRYTAKDESGNPLLEIKPDDPNRNETVHDTFTLPIGSTKRDVKRMGKFMASSDGLVFLLKQEFAQTGNEFSQTRLINPLFVIENAIPFVHAERSLGKPTSIEVGHLQKHTADAAIARVMGNSGGVSGIMALFSGTSLGQLFQGVINRLNIGVAAERPELDVGGNLYAVQLWRGGYQKHPTLNTNIEDAKNSLRSGNIPGAYNSVKQAVNTVVDGVTAFGNLFEDKFSSTGARKTTSTDMDGRRYFITSRDTVDGYLIGNTDFLHRQPYILPNDSGMPEPSFKKATIGSTANNFISSRDISGIVNNALGSSGISPLASAFSNSAISALVANSFAAFLNSNPDVTTHLRFASLAMINRYQNDERLAFVRQELKKHKDDTKRYWASHTTKTGFTGDGLQPGDPVIIDPKVRNSKRRYIHDKMNDVAVLANNGKSVNKDTLKTLDKYGVDLIRVHFFDYVNQRVIPFRAFITDINETVVPEFQDTRYIGRIERNIVYAGVTRELNFTLFVQAFGASEMDNVWKKINYITGLCYPATYDHGFMVPPFVKLTIGDFYRDQPGYIRSLNHHIDENDSWETTEGHQVPMGVTMNVGFTVIEKSTMSTNGVNRKNIFYPVGE